MHNEEGSVDPEDALIEVAADWAVKNERGFTAAEQDAFFQWLSESPKHGECYAYYRNGLKDFNLLAQWCPEHSMKPNPDLLEVKEGKRRWFPWFATAVAAAAAVALVLFLGAGESNENAQELRPLRIASTEYLHRVLSDGSEIDLRANTEISVRYSDRQRLVELVSGEAHFTVTKNPQRPFVVKVGGTQVQAIGTAFNVKIGPKELGVLVTEGEIRIDRQIAEAFSNESELAVEKWANSERESQVSEFLVSGQYSEIPYRTEGDVRFVTTSLESEEIEKLLAWKHVLLDFNETPLSEVVAEFNKRNETQMRIEGSSLEKLPIIASFRSDEIESFVDLLDRYLKIEIRRERDGTIVLSDR